MQMFRICIRFAIFAPLRPASHAQPSQPGIIKHSDMAEFPMDTLTFVRAGLPPLRLKFLSVVVCNALALPLAVATDTTLSEVEVRSEAQGSFTSASVQVGTFRDQSPVDVPMTNNVVTRETLDAQGQRTLFGALRNTAGVTRSQLSGSTYDNIAIRGILVENRGNYRLNGSLPIVNLIDIPLENKERVEVLKGASSMYYGFVPPSGIVNLVTKRPTTEPLTTIAASINNHGAADLHLDISRRFGERNQLGTRVNVVTGKEDIGIENYEGDRQLVSAAFDLKATANLGFKLDVEHYRKEVSEQAAIALPTAVNGRITLPKVPDNKSNLAGEWQKYNADATNILFRTDYLINDDWSALLEIGHAETNRDRRYSNFRNYNLATGAGQLQIWFQDGQKFTNENWRAELNGRVSALGAVHELTFGATGNERDQDSRNSDLVNVAQNLYNPVDIAPRERTNANAANPSSIRDKGLYVQDRILLGEHWQVLLGVRESDYRSKTLTTNYSVKETGVNGSLIFKPTTNTSVYASYLEGLEETGQAPANRANAGEILPPSVNKQYELGVKSMLASNTLLQAALFRIERPFTTVNAANVFGIGGEAEYTGIELAASGEITRNLGVVASAVFMNPEIVKTTNAAELGKTPENTAKRTASLFAEYRIPGVAGLSVNGGWFYTGERAVNNANQAYIDDYSTFSLGARYLTRIAGKKTTWQINVDNVADKDYWSAAGNGLLGVGAPRTVRLGVRMEL